MTLKLYYDMNADTEQESTDSGPEEKADREDLSPAVKNHPLLCDLYRTGG